jgi:hypothetical protein
MRRERATNNPNQFDKSGFKFARAEDYPQTPGEEQRNPHMAGDQSQVNRQGLPKSPDDGKRRPGRPPKDPVAFFAARAARLGPVQETEALQAEADQADKTPAVDSPRVMTTIRGNPYDTTDLAIDANFLATLPDELQEEVIMDTVAKRRSQAVGTGSQPSDMDQEFLDALPDDIRDEIIRQERVDKRRREREERNCVAEYLVNQPTRRAKERNRSGVKGLSPPNLDQLSGQLPPLDLSSIPSGVYNSLQNRDARTAFSAIPNHEHPIFSAGLISASIDWSAYDGPELNNEKFQDSLDKISLITSNDGWALNKRNRHDVEELLERPWCYYCERDFDDLKILIAHQKAQHFKCERCGRRLNTAGGLSVHMNQVHKETLSSVENSLPNRQGLEVEIFGMEGIPEEVTRAHNQRIIDGNRRGKSIATTTSHPRLAPRLRFPWAQE